MSEPDPPPALPDALREHLERLKATMRERVRAELRRLREEDRARRLAGGVQKSGEPADTSCRAPDRGRKGKGG